MNKKFSAVIAAVVAVALGVCFAVSSFGFVKDNYGEDQIRALSDIGLIGGSDVGASVTRGEALRTVMIAASLDGDIEDYTGAATYCPYVDMSADLEPYIVAAYSMGIVSDMPFDEFRETDNITLTEMLVITLRACGYTVTEADDVFGIAENALIYKTCEADMLVFELPYACYAEILWNMLNVKGVSAEKTFAELLIDSGFMTPEAFEAAKVGMADYVFGQEHDYATNAIVRTDPVSEEDSTSDSGAETTTPNGTTTPTETTTAPTTTYDTEDNSGYSPPFKP